MRSNNLEKKRNDKIGYRALWRKDLRQGIAYFNTLFLSLDEVTANDIINPVIARTIFRAI